MKRSPLVPNYIHTLLPSPRLRYNLRTLLSFKPENKSFWQFARIRRTRRKRKKWKEERMKERRKEERKDGRRGGRKGGKKKRKKTERQKQRKKPISLVFNASMPSEWCVKTRILLVNRVPYEITTPFDFDSDAYGKLASQRFFIWSYYNRTQDAY